MDIEKAPRWKIWAISTRPKTLVATAGPLIISIAYLLQANHEVVHPFPWVRVLVVGIACFILQIACNFTNDYYDYLRGTDDESRVGPKRMLQLKAITKEEMLKGLVVLYLAFFVISLTLAFILNWMVLFLAIVSMASAFFYTGGRYPLAYYGLGDLFAFWFFGPLLTIIVIYVNGLGYTHFDPYTAFYLGLGSGFFSLALININNIRDLEQDQAKSKRTAALFWGKATSLRLLNLYFALAMLVPMVVGWYYEKSGYLLLFIFLIPIPIFFFKVSRATSTQFNQLIGFVAKIYIVQSLSFALIWFFG